MGSDADDPDNELFSSSTPSPFLGLFGVENFALRILPKNYDPKQAAGRERSHSAHKSAAACALVCTALRVI